MGHVVILPAIHLLTAMFIFDDPFGLWPGERVLFLNS